jgi:hypothetical protein
VRHLIKPCCFCYVPSSQTLLFYRTSATLRVLNSSRTCIFLRICCCDCTVTGTLYQPAGLHGYRIAKDLQISVLQKHGERPGATLTPMTTNAASMPPKCQHHPPHIARNYLTLDNDKDIKVEVFLWANILLGKSCRQKSMVLLRQVSHCVWCWQSRIFSHRRSCLSRDHGNFDS